MRARIFVILAMTLGWGCTEDDESMETDPGGQDPISTEAALEQAEASPGTWTWIPVDTMKCRDGSSTGFAVRISDRSSNWGIHLQGGGACFETISCSPFARNARSFGEADLDDELGDLSIGFFDNSNPENPVADWNMAFIPYCTGDVFSGSTEGVPVPGVGVQDFVGKRNVSAVTSLLSERYANVPRVLLNGSSAGGFGVFFNFEDVASKFPDAQLDLVSDSAQPLPPGPALPSCLVQHWIDLWGIQLPEGCSDCGADQNGLLGVANYLSSTYVNSSFALASHLEDETIRTFYGAGEDDCSFSLPSADLPEIDAVVFSTAVSDLRNESGLQGWSTLYQDSTRHTFFDDTSDFNSEFTTWLGQVLDGEFSDVGP